MLRFLQLSIRTHCRVDDHEAGNSGYNTTTASAVHEVHQTVSNQPLRVLRTTLHCVKCQKAYRSANWNARCPPEPKNFPAVLSGLLNSGEVMSFRKPE